MRAQQAGVQVAVDGGFYPLVVGSYCKGAALLSLLVLLKHDGNVVEDI